MRMIVMGIYPVFARRVMLPFIDIVSKTSVSTQLKFFEKSQWWSYKELNQYQSDQLRKLVSHAYQKVPYYHREMKKRNIYPNDIKTSKDLVKLPVINKDEIRKNPKDFLANDFKVYQPKEMGTSGTSGTPFRYYLDLYRWSMNAAVINRNYAVGGYLLGQKRVEIAGFNVIPNKKHDLKDIIQNSFQRKVIFSCIQLSNGIIHKYINKINKFKPLMIVGYPSALEAISDYAISNEVEIFRPKAIFTVAEKLYDFQREKLKKVFSCDLFEGYGGSDVGVFTIDCEEHNRHICIDTGVMEFVDETWSNVPIGEKGEIVTTMLSNYSQVFIRYSPGDIGVATNEICPCGRGYPLMKEVIGRTLDTIKFSNGVILNPAALTVLFKNFNFKQFQIIQEKIDKLKIKAVKGKNYKESETAKILEIMKCHCGEGVDIEIEFIDEIATTASGKRRYIISKINK